VILAPIAYKKRANEPVEPDSRSTPDLGSSSTETAENNANAAQVIYFCILLYFLPVEAPACCSAGHFYTAHELHQSERARANAAATAAGCSGIMSQGRNNVDYDSAGFFSRTSASALQQLPDACFV
jgi:hypothetical protein